MKNFIRWITQYKKRTYIVTYYSVGFMGNMYKTGVFKFKVSDKELKNMNVNFIQYGFYENQEILQRHYRLKNGRFSLISSGGEINN